jgi:methyl-accepting chemotaxis protein
MAQLTFKVGANTIEAVTSLDKLIAKVQGMTSEIKAGGDSFTRMDSNAEKLAQRLGVDMTKSLEKTVVAYQSLYDYLVKVGAPMADQQRALEGLDAAQRKFAQAAGPSFWQEHKTAIVGAATAIVGFGVMAVKAFEESEKAGAQLDAVLKSTGMAAGVTKEQAENLALSLMKLTGIDDEAILGAETILLQFTKIGKDVFPEATKAVLDLSVRLGKDLPSAAMLVGKALGDPVNGMTALQKATGKFTDTEVDAIKAMVEHGRVAEAQTVILTKLQEKFGGAAEAAGKTFAGAMGIARGEANNFMEAVGGQIVPVLTDLMQTFPDLATVVVGTGSAFGKLNISAGELLIAIPLMKTAFEGLGAGILAASASLGLITVGIGALVGIGWAAVGAWKAQTEQMNSMGQAAQTAQKATEALEARAKLYGITIDRGTMSQEQYNAALFAALGPIDHISTSTDKATESNKFHVLSIAEKIAALQKEADAINGVLGQEKNWQTIMEKIAGLRKQAAEDIKRQSDETKRAAEEMKQLSMAAGSHVVELQQQIDKTEKYIAVLEKNGSSAEELRQVEAKRKDLLHQLAIQTDVNLAAYDRLIKAEKDLDKAMISTDDTLHETWVRAKNATEALNAMVNPLAALGNTGERTAPALEKVASSALTLKGAFKELQMQSAQDLQGHVDDTRRAYEAIVATWQDADSKNIVGAQQVLEARKKMLVAMAEAYNAGTLQMSDIQAKALQKEIETVTEASNKLPKILLDGGSKMGEVWSNQVSTIVTDFSKGIADMVFAGKGFAETMEGIFKEFGKSILRILLEGLFQPLTNWLKKVGKDIGDWLGGLFGGGKSGTAGGGGGLSGLLSGLGGLGTSIMGGIGGAFGLGPLLGGGTAGMVGGGIAGFMGGQIAANVGASMSAGTGAMAGLSAPLQIGALSIPFAGPIIAAIGLAIGPLINKLTQRGREKKIATGGAEELSSNVWDTIIPSMKDQAVGFTEGVNQIQAAWDSYVDFLHKNLKDQTVIQRSIDTQRISLTQGMEAAAKMGIERVMSTFDEIGKTRTVTDEMIANLQDIATGMEKAGTAAQQAGSKFAVLGAQFLQTGQMTDDFAAAITKAGGSVDFFNEATAKLNQLKGLQADFLGLKQAIDALLPKQQSWIDKFVETGEITDELVDKIVAAGGSIVDFKAYSDMKQVKNNFESLLATFNQTGEVSAELLSYIMQYGDPATVAAFEKLMKAADKAGVSITDFAKDNKDAAKDIQTVMNSTAAGIDAAFEKSASKLSDTLGKMAEDLGKSIQALQDALVTMIKDLIDVILEIPGAAEKATNDFNKFMGLLEPPKLDPITISFVIDQDRLDLQAQDAALRARQVMNHEFGQYSGTPSQNIPTESNPTRGAGTGTTTTYLPRMAEGGIVTRPTAVVAGDSGPEAIIPLNQAGGLGGNIYITVEKVETADPDKFIDQLVNMAQTNRSGTRKRLKRVLG